MYINPSPPPCEGVCDAVLNANQRNAHDDNPKMLIFSTCIIYTIEPLKSAFVSVLIFGNEPQTYSITKVLNTFTFSTK